MTPYDIIKTLALPPADLIIALTIGIALIARGRRRAGLTIVAVATFAFYVLSTPIVGAALMRIIQAPPASGDALAKSDAQAIVVLSAGFVRYAPEYGGPTVDQLTLQRLRYGAHLARQLHLPLLVSGGSPDRAPAPLAQLMKAAAENDFGVEVRWTEDRSNDTYENAAFSAAILKSADVHNILLVTHAAHMRRAQRLFEAEGLSVTPAPTVFETPFNESQADILPRLSGMQDSYYAIYEILGALWYKIRH